jgi:hypothetical protein
MRASYRLLRLLTWTLLVLALVTPSRAQDLTDETYAAPAPAYGFFDIGLGLAIPNGDFRDQTDNVGFGVNVAAGVGSRDLPFAVGVEGGFYVLGQHTDNVPLSTTVNRVFVDVQTTNNLAQGHVFLRMQPASGAVRPFVEGLIGAKYLYTESSVQNEGWGDREDVFRSTNFDDWAFSYGVGAGAAIELHRTRKPGADFRTLSLLVSARWTPGSSAQYLSDTDLYDRNNDGVVTTPDFDVSRSRTDVIVPTIGVQFTF